MSQIGLSKQEVLYDTTRCLIVDHSYEKIESSIATIRKILPIFDGKVVVHPSTVESINGIFESTV